MIRLFEFACPIVLGWCFFICFRLFFDQAKYVETIQGLVLFKRVFVSDIFFFRAGWGLGPPQVGHGSRIRFLC